MAGLPEMEGFWFHFVETVYGAWLYRRHRAGRESCGGGAARKNRSAIGDTS